MILRHLNYLTPYEYNHCVGTTVRRPEAVAGGGGGLRRQPGGGQRRRRREAQTEPRPETENGEDGEIGFGVDSLRRQLWHPALRRRPQPQGDKDAE